MSSRAWPSTKVEGVQMGDMQALRRFLAMAIVSLVLAGCSEPGTSGPTVEAQDSQLVALGSRLYETKCAECHGSDLRGTDRGPSHLSIIYEPGHHSDFAFQQAVRFGSQQHHWSFGDMPPVEGLSDEDVVAITAFVRENQRTNGFEQYPPGS